MLFKYIVSTKKGEIKKGEIEISDKNEAVKKLLGQGFLIVSLEEKKKRLITSFTLRRVSDLEKMSLVRNMAMMIKAGLSLDRIIDSLKDQTQNLKLKKILIEVKEKIERGLPLSTALSFHPEIFSSLFLGLIKLGEESGNLDKTSKYLCSQLESRYEFKKKVKSALIYPLMVVSLAIIITFSLFIFLLPKISRLFSHLEVELPIFTRIFVTLVNFFQENLIYLLFSPLFLIILFSILTKNIKIKKFFQKFSISLPIFGKIVRNVNLSYLAQTLSLLLKSGMPIEKTLETTFEVIENQVYKERINKILEGIRKGEKLSSNLEKYSREFPIIFSKTVESGEKTGRLDESLLYLASFYSREVEREMKNLTIALEPILLIIVGLGVGFIALALISPIYQYISALGELK